MGFSVQDQAAPPVRRYVHNRLLLGSLPHLGMEVFSVRNQNVLQGRYDTPILMKQTFETATSLYCTV